MAFISVFDVLGPNMIGPSSSHTAGAAAISFLARKMIAPPIVKVEFTLYGSFAKTYQGHGTDRALLGGLMGFETDDTRIRNSFQIAQDRGLDYRFTPCTTETEVHPNTVDIRMENAAGQTMVVRGESLGGGKVRIVRINGVEVDFTGAYSTVIVVQQDKPGVVAHITKVLSDNGVNIAFMRLFREAKGHTAYTIVESDGRLRRGSTSPCGTTPTYRTSCCWSHRRRNPWTLNHLLSCWSCAGRPSAPSQRSCAAGSASWGRPPGIRWTTAWPRCWRSCGPPPRCR